MIEELIWLTAASIVGSTLLAYLRTKDALHPMIFMGPMMFYVYVLIPGTSFYRGELDSLFPDQNALQVALIFTLLSVSAFSLGCLRHQLPPGRSRGFRQSLDLNPEARKWLGLMGYALGAIGLSIFLYRLFLSGGLFQVYSRPKGGSASLFSGYLTVAPLLTIPSLLLLLLSWHGQRQRPAFPVIMLILISPHLIQGLLGGSRGPTFLALGSLFFGWFIIRSRKPSLRAVLAVLLGSGLLMLFLKAHRQEFYLGSEESTELKGWGETFLPDKGTKDHAGMFSLAGIVVSRHHGYCLRGKGLATQLFVRAIPRQLWPNKYEAVGMGWMVTRPGSLGMSPSQWREAIGWEPNAGTASGFVLSVFVEFSWGGLFVAYLLGWFYGWLWKRSAVEHGLWSILYAEACIVSVYLPTQGLISAWGFRFLYLAIPTILLVRYVRRAPQRRGVRRVRIPPKIIEFLDTK